MTLLRPAPGLCDDCGRDHDPAQPHDALTLFWQTDRNMKGLDRSWMAAMAHCTPEVQAHWVDTLTTAGVDVTAQYGRVV
jgi:hypothetical protein